jgi:hypothetical protein
LDFIYPTGRAWAEDFDYPPELVFVLPGVSAAGARSFRIRGINGSEDV